MVQAPEETQDIQLELAHKKFLLKTTDVPGLDKDKLKGDILEVVFRDDLAPIYESLCAELGLPVDSAKLQDMKSKNAAKLVELEAKLSDAQENLGETEVRDALHAKALYLCAIGDREAAAKAFTETEAKTAGSGKKMDLVFSQIRLNMFYGDWHKVKVQLARAKQLCDEGGDWERKNKLKVYQAVFAMYSRDFKQASALFQDAIATFSATELFSYQQVIFYVVVTSIIALDRVELKAKVVDAPEILTAIGQTPHLKEYLDSLYSCQYQVFFRAFNEIITLIKSDPYLAAHVRYYMREVRVVAYAQFLESYKSVTLASMAAAFDVSPSFIDLELAGLIVSGRLNAKIDKVAGVIETNRPDAKNALYHDSIKKGDLLLNRIQKLSKVIDVE
ncbi:26S proteasome regulatory complex [Haematococcus lacustris]